MTDLRGLDAWSKLIRPGSLRDDASGVVTNFETRKGHPPFTRRYQADYLARRACDYPLGPGNHAKGCPGRFAPFLVGCKWVAVLHPEGKLPYLDAGASRSDYLTLRLSRGTLMMQGGWLALLAVRCGRQRLVLDELPGLRQCLVMVVLALIAGSVSLEN